MPANQMHHRQAHGCSFVRFDIQAASPVVIDKTFHDDISIIAFTNSVWSSTQNRTQYQETPGMVVMRDAGQVYSARSEHIDTKGAACFELRVSPAQLEHIYASFGMRLPRLDFHKPVLQHAGMYQRVLRTHDSINRSGCLLAETSDIMLLLGGIAGVAAQTTQHHGRHRLAVGKAIDYLRERFAQQVSLQELAAHTRSNPFVLLRQFRAATGTTPHEYLINCRIAHARRLIVQGQPLSEVAFACGFADQSHFTRFFKRKVGVTPGAYRNLA